MTDEKVSSQTVITVEDCMRGAFAALLRGDTAERDRLVALAETAFKGRDAVPRDEPVELHSPEQRRKMS